MEIRAVFNGEKLANFRYNILLESAKGDTDRTSSANDVQVAHNHDLKLSEIILRVLCNGVVGSPKI